MAKITCRITRAHGGQTESEQFLDVSEDKALEVLASFPFDA